MSEDIRVLRRISTVCVAGGWADVDAVLSSDETDYLRDCVEQARARQDASWPIAELNLYARDCQPPASLRVMALAAALNSQYWLESVDECNLNERNLVATSNITSNALLLATPGTLAKVAAELGVPVEWVSAVNVFVRDGMSWTTACEAAKLVI